MKTLIQKLVSTPYRIFLVDGLGALLSSALLLLLIAPFETYFGMPQQIVFILGAVAFVLMSYSFTCYSIKSAKWRTHLKFIIAANIVYAFITITLVFIYFDQLTSLGLLYFLLELFVLMVLVYLELQVHSITNSN